MLTEAARNYEEITGEEVDIEESAISEALKKLAHGDRERVLPLSAKVSALGLPGDAFLSDHQRTLEGILGNAPDDCVRTLANEGKSYKGARERVSRIAAAMTEANLDIIRGARLTLQQEVPALARRWAGDEPLREVAERLKSNLEADSFYDRLPEIGQDNNTLEKAYEKLYSGVHQRRGEAFEKAIEMIKGLPEWPALATDIRSSILMPLTLRFCPEMERSDSGDAVCSRCRAGVEQMESDITAAESLKKEALKRVEEALAEPGERVEYVRVADFFPGSITSSEELEKALGELREHISRLLTEGVRIVLE